MYLKADQLSKPPKKPRQRKCASCREWFQPEKQGEVVCSTQCAIDNAGKTLKKQVKREKQKAKRELNEKDKSYLMKKAQSVFNKYIRLRDEKQPCISCGHLEGRQFHAGHYRPVGKNGQHRFNEDNCHSQCSICNNYLSGNLVSYREGLIFKIGEKRVVALENQNTPKRWTVSELKEIIEAYSQKIKDM